MFFQRRAKIGENMEKYELYRRSPVKRKIPPLQSEGSLKPAVFKSRQKILYLNY
jgi:hypothetical protein